MTRREFPMLTLHYTHTHTHINTYIHAHAVYVITWMQILRARGRQSGRYGGR
jgi:hypothetical protein